MNALQRKADRRIAQLNCILNHMETNGIDKDRDRVTTKTGVRLNLKKILEKIDTRRTFGTVWVRFQ